MSSSITNEARWKDLDNQRATTRQIAEECSRLTIPYVLPPQGTDEVNMVYESPYQAIGAQGTTNLASKLLQSMFSSTDPFLRLDINELNTSEVDPEILQEVYSKLSLMEERIQSEFDTKNMRSQIFTAFEHLIITGNYLLEYLESGELKGYRFDRWVCQRDAEGNLVELMTLQSIAWAMIPQEIKSKILMSYRKEGIEESPKATDEFKVYLRAQRDTKGKWTWSEEIDGILVDKGTYKNDDTFPFMVLRWTENPHEHYGRGLTEKYLGDLQNLESMHKSIIDYNTLASKIVLAIDPKVGSSIKAKDLSSLETGAIIRANPDALRYLTIDKQRDYVIIMDNIASKTKVLQRAYMDFGAITRDAERVTAEEIRQLSHELETSLGGVYTLFVSQLQRPLAVKLMQKLEVDKEMPDIVKELKNGDQLKLIIATGLQALNRSADVQKYQMFLAMAQQDPELNMVINKRFVVSKIVDALRIDQGVLLTEEQLQEQQQLAIAMEALKGGGLSGNQQGTTGTTQGS